MARAQFDREYVVQQAMQLFWRQGYSASSMQDVFDATGLKPGSIYLAFGSKDGLYRAAIELFALQTTLYVEQKFVDANDPLTAIVEIFCDAVLESAQSNYCMCFVMRSRMEFEPGHEIYELCGEIIAAVEGLYASKLIPVFGEEQGSAYASSLMVHLFGARVYGINENSADILLGALKTGMPWLPWEA